MTKLIGNPKTGWQKLRIDTLAANLGKSEARVTDLRANCVRLANYIERHHTLELDTEAALLVSEARKTVLNTGGVLQ